MPGFIINGVGGAGFGAETGVPSTEQYYYTYCWEIQTLFVKDGLQDLKNIKIHAKDATLPTFTVGIERKQGASLEYKYAKSVTFDDVKLSFYDTNQMLPVLSEWRKRIWSAEGGLKSAHEYKADTTIAYGDPSWTLNNGFKLMGSWPSTIRHGDLSYATSDVKIVEVTVTYDYAIELGID